MRWIRHWIGRERVGNVFNPSVLDAIQATIAAGEQSHLGEVCFAVEGGVAFPGTLFRDVDARRRAVDAFGRLGVWDTADNTGVLVYVLLAEHAIEIIADRGITAKVDPSQWQAICTTLEQAYRRGDFSAGSVAAIEAIHALLVEHFPVGDTPNPDELPNRPVIL